MSNLSSGLIPLNKGRTTTSGSSITSLGDAPSFSKQNSSNRATAVPMKFSKNSDESDDDLDALFDDEPKAGSAKARGGKVTTKTNTIPALRKFKSTMKDFSDSEDNSNNFDDSVSSSGSPIKGSRGYGNYDDSLSPISDKGIGVISPQKGNPLLENISFASDDLDDSILGGLVGGTPHVACHYITAVQTLPSS